APLVAVGVRAIWQQPRRCRVSYSAQPDRLRNHRVRQSVSPYVLPACLRSMHPYIYAAAPALISCALCSLPGDQINYTAIGERGPNRSTDCKTGLRPWTAEATHCPGTEPCLTVRRLPRPKSGRRTVYTR